MARDCLLHWGLLKRWITTGVIVSISSAALSADPASVLSPKGDARAPKTVMRSDIRDLREHIKARQWQAAEEVSSRLLTELSRGSSAAHSSRFEEVVIALRSMRAMVLVELNRTDEAIPLLRQVIEQDQVLKERSRSAAGDKRLSSLGALAFSRALEDVNRYTDRYLLQRLGIDGNLAGIMELPDSLPRVDIPHVALMRAYIKGGFNDEATKVFDNEFKHFLQQIREFKYPGRTTSAWIESLACLTAAVELSKLGRTPQADDAFQCSFRAEARIDEITPRFLPGTLLSEAWANRKRLIAGAYAHYILGTRLLTSAVPEADGERIAELIGQSKGASGYVQAKRQDLINRTPGPTMQKARDMYADLEPKLTERLANGMDWPAAVTAWIEEENVINKLAGEAVFQAGLERQLMIEPNVVARVMKRLKAADSTGGAAYIGFFSYRPFDTERRELQDAVVLRYVITPGHVQVRQIGSSREVGRLVNDWRNRHLVDDPTVDSWARDQEVSRVLLAGMPARVNDALSWIIDPDGMLNLIPIEALPHPGADIGEGPTILDRHIVSYTTSMLVYADSLRESLGDRPWSEYPGRSLLVADPVFTAKLDSDSTKNKAVASRSMAFGRIRVAGGMTLSELSPQALPETRSEVLAVRNALHAKGVSSDMHVGEKATPDSFRLQGTPAVVHVATHGVFLEPGILTNDEKFVRVASIMPGLLSALVLAPADGRVLLTGDDIARLPLRGTQLVVFSACDTGNGDVMAGEGVMSLRRSVEKAGALTSVTSIWSVPSKATTNLMENFYVELARGKSKAEALRNAKLTVRKAHKEPRFWAGFLLAGEP